MLARTTSLVLPVLFSIFTLVGRADERSDTAAKQKDAAVSNLNKIGIGKPNVHESADLIFVSPLPVDKLKAISDAVQKHYATAFKALKYDANDEPWNGKLAVCVLTDRAQFNSSVRTVEQRRPESDEVVSLDVRSDNPHVTFSSDRSDTPALADDVSKHVSIALLARKAGSTAGLPGWFKEAFARAVRMRLDPRGGTADKAAIRKTVLSKTKAVKPADAWAEADSAEKSIIALSLVDYLAFGPESKFGSVLSALRPSDDNASPTFESALTSAGFTPEALDKGWKKWVQSGK